MRLPHDIQHRSELLLAFSFVQYTNISTHNMLHVNQTAPPLLFKIEVFQGRSHLYAFDQKKLYTKLIKTNGCNFWRLASFLCDDLEQCLALSVSNDTPFGQIKQSQYVYDENHHIPWIHCNSFTFETAIIFAQIFSF